MSASDRRTEAFGERAFIDHHCLRHLRRYLDGDIVNEEAVYRERDRLIANLGEAARYGMTSYVVFSRSFELLQTYDFLDRPVYPADSAGRRRVEFLCAVLDDVLDAAQRLGLKIVFHTNQFEFPDAVYEAVGDEISGTARVCPGKERTWELFRGKLDAFLSRFPRVAALQLTTSETQVRATDCACEACRGLDARERFLRFIGEAHQVCSDHGVECQLRTWGQLDDRKLYPEFAASLPAGVAVSTKNTAWDFHLTSPVNELIGTGAAPQLVEFDCWGEYCGWNRFPCYMGDLLADRLRYCHEHGIDRVHARINWNPGTDRIFDVPFGNVVNVELFAALARDPYQRPDDLLDAWLRRTFQTSAVDRLARFYRNTPRVQRTALLFLDHQCGSHSCVFYNLGSRSYEERIRKMCSDRTASIIAQRPALVARREETVRQTWDGVRDELHALRDCMPADWNDDLLHRAECGRFVSLVNTAALKLYVCMARPDDTTFEVETVAGDVRRLVEQWQRHDARHATWMEAAVAEEIVEEARAKRKGGPVPRARHVEEIRAERISTDTVRK